MCTLTLCPGMVSAHERQSMGSSASCLDSVADSAPGRRQISFRLHPHSIILAADQACVSRLSAFRNTVVPDRVICYKSVTDTAGTGCGAQTC